MTESVRDRWGEWGERMVLAGWTLAPPDKPGWYWIVGGPGSEPSLREITLRLDWQDHKRRPRLGTHETPPRFVDDLGWWWWPHTIKRPQAVKL